MKASLIVGILLGLVIYFYLEARSSEPHPWAPWLITRPHFDSANVEIIALSAAIENYRSDHGHYPTDRQTTERLNPNGRYRPAIYEAAGAFLYRALSGADEKDKKNYLADFPGRFLSTDQNAVTRIVDPWKNCLGYSTLKATHPEASGGNNPTFDLWSTGRDATKSKQVEWIKNW